MKKDLSKLEAHLERSPTDAQGVISLLKAQSHNFEYDFNLNIKRKREKMNSIKRMEKKHDSN
ncbi:hypothetical protein [Lactococcus sp. DD01]|uniref:hypothetical protein n=1 Tax=Lactococcus sp. DD01 TaxID=1776443 RepID=UPI00077649A6|nr:hypothetical protein [Lactococcus sp. DD01]KXT63153.1 hypothetical protein LACDD01_00180 [Lactococcus sp. DD01]